MQNVFWRIRGCEIYRALSWDRLHAYHLGLFGKHLLGELKRLLEDRPDKKEILLKVEKQYSVFIFVNRILLNIYDYRLREIARWPGLYHFTTLHTGEFSDGSRFEQLSKVGLAMITSVFINDSNFEYYDYRLFSMPHKISLLKQLKVRNTHLPNYCEAIWSLICFYH